MALTVLFGVQSMHAYVQFGWLPQVYRDAGISASHAGALQALLSGVGIAGALVLPTIIARGRGLRAMAVSFGVMLALGIDGPDWLRSRLRTGVVVWTDGRVEAVG